MNQIGQKKALALAVSFHVQCLCTESAVSSKEELELELFWEDWYCVRGRVSSLTWLGGNDGV